MGNVQAIPVIGEVVTVAEGAGKAIAAGACAAVGQTEAANQLIQGAEQTFVNYTEVSAIAANVHMAVAAGCGDDEKVRRLQDRQEKAWLDLAENTPGVGHGIGIGRYIAGDTEGGDRCMIGATRSTLVAAATVATGGAAAVAGGVAAAGTGLAYDVVVTELNSVGKGQHAPVGFVASVERTTPAVELETQRPRRPSVPENYKPYPVVPDSVAQVSLAELRGNHATAAFVKEFRTPEDAVRGLEWGQKYDFVRFLDSSVRAISRADAAEAGRILKNANTPVGHASLVEPGASVVAAGEIHITPTGVWKNINCQSGHFRVPLKTMKRQVGRAFPRSMLTFESPTFANLLSEGTNGVAKNFTHIAVYTSSLLALLNTQAITPPLASSTFILAFHEHTAVKTIALGTLDFALAKQAYNAMPLIFAKVLIQKPSNTVLCRHGLNEYVDMCIQQVRQINAVFPQRTWRQTSKGLESCFDPETGKFLMRCSCRTYQGDWVVNSVQFKQEDRFENQNGKLVKLI